MIKFSRLDVKKTFIVSFLIVALIPLILMTTMLIAYTSKLYAQADEQIGYVQNQIATSSADVLAEIRRHVSNFYSNNGLADLYTIDTADEYFKSKKIRDIIASFETALEHSNHAKNIYLYIESTDIILSNQGILTSQEYYSFNQENIALSYAEWLSKLRISSAKEFYQVGNRGNDSTLNYFCSVSRPPYRLPKTNTPITLAMCIPMKEFFHGTQGISWLPHCDTYFFDTDRDFIFSKINNSITTSAQPNIYDLLSKENGFTAVLHTPISFGTTHWTVISVSNKLHLFKTPIYMTWLSVFAVLICLILVFIAISTLTKRNYSPIENLFSILKIQNDKPEYSSLANSIQTIIRQNEGYLQDIKIQKKHLKNILLHKLLDGNLSSNLIYSLERYDVCFPYANYCVLTIDISTLKNTTYFTQYELLENTLTEMFSEYTKGKDIVFFSTYEKMQLFFIFNSARSDYGILDELLPSIRLCCDSVESDFDIAIRLSISNIHFSHSEISVAYLESIEASHSPDNILRINEYKKISKNTRHYFTSTQENSIINHLKNGDFKNVSAVLEEIFSDINEFSPKLNEHITYDIICMYLKLPYLLELNANEEITDLLTFSSFFPYLKSLDALFDYFLQVSEKICNFITVKKQSTNDHIAEKAAKFIEENYSNINLTPAAVCEYVHASNSYLSKIFKNKYNITIHAYIHQHRVSVAKHLLEQHIPTTKVSIMVGYNNPRTFNRAFQSIENISPSDYRKKFL